MVFSDEILENSNYNVVLMATQDIKSSKEPPVFALEKLLLSIVQDHKISTDILKRVSEIILMNCVYLDALVSSPCNVTKGLRPDGTDFKGRICTTKATHGPRRTHGEIMQKN